MAAAHHHGFHHRLSPTQFIHSPLPAPLSDGSIYCLVMVKQKHHSPYIFLFIFYIIIYIYIYFYINIYIRFFTAKPLVFRKITNGFRWEKPKWTDGFASQ